MASPPAHRLDRRVGSRKDSRAQRLKFGARLLVEKQFAQTDEKTILWLAEPNKKYKYK